MLYSVNHRLTFGPEPDAIPNGPEPGAGRHAFRNLAGTIELADLALFELGEPQVAVAPQRDAGRARSRLVGTGYCAVKAGGGVGGGVGVPLVTGVPPPQAASTQRPSIIKKERAMGIAPAYWQSGRSFPQPGREAPSPRSLLIHSLGKKAAARKREWPTGGEANRATMLRALFITVVVAVTATPAPTPPPEIYRVVSRPLCTQLRERIKPAIGMLLQNDTSIKESPALFERYNQAALSGSDAVSGSNGQQEMALLGLENLIRPIANNVIAIQTILSNPQLTTPSGREEDDKRLADMRAKLLKALATQNASLDIISGFVDTQQMADLQHAGQEYIGEVNQPETTNAQAASPSPNPLSYNPNYAGLPPNPYTIDLANVPGLTLGYNPVTRLMDGLNWTMGQTAEREHDAADAVLVNAAICNNVPLVSPTP